MIKNSIVRLKSFLWKQFDLFRIKIDETKVPDYTLPSPLRLASGDFIKSPIEWRKQRRPEIIRLFQDYVYGHNPQVCKTVQSYQISNDTFALGGLSTRKEIRLFFTGQPNSPHMHLLLYLPNHASKPVPAFLGLNFYGNHTIHSDPGISITEQWHQTNQNASAALILPSGETRGVKANRWPVEKILQRGYALATVYYGDLEPDFPDGWRYGIRSTFRLRSQLKEQFESDQVMPTAGQIKDIVGAPEWSPRENWGTIGVWAWGLSLILDYLERDSDIRASQVVLFGQSRLGKAALWAGAQDDRFAIVISNNSGCGGAALFRRRFGETIERINRSFPHWFCQNFKNFNGKEDQLPVDQHMLIALMAPRPVYISSAEQDWEADPRGEFLSAKHADPVYSLFGITGLGEEQMPGLNEPVGKTIGYHIRTGKHDVTDYDWEQYLYFADWHFGKTSPSPGVGPSQPQRAVHPTSRWHTLS